MTCPFCDLPEDRIILSMPRVFAVRDIFPASRGHTLIITRRHVATAFETDADERREMFEAMDAVVKALDEEYEPAGYNVGFNVGEAAGQTVMHVHLHVIPRYRRDVDDPRGGVRHVIPSKGNYLRGKR